MYRWLMDFINIGTSNCNVCVSSPIAIVYHIIMSKYYADYVVCPKVMICILQCGQDDVIGNMAC